MPSSAKTVRVISIVLFLLLTFPCLTFLGLTVRNLAWLWVLDTVVRAIPLYLAIHTDWTFYDGGELSEELIPLWVGLTGLLLWPLLVLGLRPVLWASRRWRKAILCYSAAALVCTVPASYWIFTHTGYLF